MKRKLFDTFMILLMAGLLIILEEFDLIEKYRYFALIPLLIFYFLGKFSERRFKSWIKL